jgi:predicted nucleotidyltransferase
MPAHPEKERCVAESDLFQSDLLLRIETTFRDLPGLAGMLLIGSAAAGRADYFSDLDLLCVWEGELDRPRRYLALRTLGEPDRASPQLLRFERLELDRLRLGSREAEFVNLALPALERLLEQVVDRQEIEHYSPDRYGFWSPLAWLQTGIVLLDPQGTMAALQARLQPLPEALAAKMIAQQFAALKLPVLYHLQKAAMRGDGLFLHTILDDITGHLLQALFAFNGRFYPGSRQLAEELATLPLKPDRLYERLTALILTAPQFARDLLPAVNALLRDVAQLCAPWYPEAVPAWALGGRAAVRA